MITSFLTTRGIVLIGGLNVSANTSSKTPPTIEKINIINPSAHPAPGVTSNSLNISSSLMNAMTTIR